MGLQGYLQIPVLTIIMCSSLAAAAKEVGSVDMRSKLRRDLLVFTKYDRLTNPVLYMNETEDQALDISMSLLVLHVHSLDEVNGVLTVNGWFYVTWIDTRLQWNPADYADVHGLHVADKTVWTPDLMIYNNAESMEIDHYGNAHMKVFNDGRVHWVPPVTLRSTCPIDHKMYPFDEHTCTITMGIWMYVSIRMHVINADEDHEMEVLEKFGTQNPLWTVLSTSTVIRNNTYTCCPGMNYESYVVTLRLRRCSPFHRFFLVTPSVMAVCLTLALFWLPPDSSSRLTVGVVAVTIELALLLFLGWRIPPGGKSIPAIVFFCGNTFLLTSLSLMLTVAVRNVSVRDPAVSPVPQRLLALLRGSTGRMLCLQSQDGQGWVHFIARVTHLEKLPSDQQPLDGGNRVEFGGSSVEDGSEANGGSSGRQSQSNWVFVGAAMDRACFLLYCFVFFIILLVSLCG